MRILLWGATLLALALQIVAIGGQSLVGDATYHLVSGHQALRYGTNTVNLEHPPLVKLVAALPLLTLEPAAGPLEPCEALDASRRVYRKPEVLLRGRLWGRTLVLLTFGLPWLVACFFLGRATGAAPCGWLLALTLGLSISVLPYVSILQTDTALAFAFALALVGGLRYADRPSRSAVALMGLGLGLGLAAKLSGPLLVPTLATALAAGWWHQRDWRRTTVDALAVAVLAVAVPAVVYAVANHDYDPAAGREAIVQYTQNRGTLIVDDELRPHRETLLSVERLHPGAAQWLTGLLGIAVQNRLGVYPSLAFGRFDSGGRWWYFPVVFLVKTPLVILVMLAAAAVTAARRVSKAPNGRERASPHGRLRWVVLVVTALVYLAAAVTSSYNIGIRHLLPIVPILYLPVACWAARRRWRAAVLVAVLTCEATLVTPLWMSATNTWWLGAANPTRFALGGSDLEYRQNFLTLRDALDARGIHRVGVLYPTLAPEMLHAYLPDAFLAHPGRSLRPGWYAVNAQLEQSIPAIFRAEPDELHNRPLLLQIAESWRPHWRSVVERAEDHGYVAGTFHLYRIPPADQPSGPPR